MEKEVKLTVSVRSIFKLVMFCVTTTTRTCDEQKISTHSRKKKLFLWEIEFQYVFISTTIALLLQKGGKDLIF